MKDIKLHNFSKKDDDTVEEEMNKHVEEVWDKIYSKELKLKRIEPDEKRIVDQYSREEIGAHLDHYLAHCTARGIQPTKELIVDWLYSTKRPTETDDFVKIERLIQMLQQGLGSKILIKEVLEYCLKLEKAALAVYDELFFLQGTCDSIDNLRDVLDIRLKVRDKEENSKAVETTESTNSLKSVLDGKMK